MTRLVNLGCKLNQYEGHCLLEHFRTGVNPMGLQSAPDRAAREVVIVNTCVVTKEAERKSLKKIRRALALQPRPVVMVTGCLVGPRTTVKMPEVDYVISAETRQEIVADIRPRPPHTRYFLKIQDGCNRFCSYCIVPLVRGRSRSVPRSRIVDEVGYARDHGYPEIVLTGVNLGAYGADTATSLDELLDELRLTPGLPRLRLSSLEPAFLTPRLLDRFGTTPLCHHLHLSIQSGAPSVLTAMNRHHDLAAVESWLRQAVDFFTDFAFGADIIVGFPNEDESAFRATFDFVTRSPFSYLHVFPYSPRPGTAAYTMGDSVGPDEKRRRVRELRDLSREKALAFRRRFVDHELAATYEGRGRGHFGLTANYIRVLLDRSPDKALFRLRITEVTPEVTRGTVL